MATKGTAYSGTEVSVAKSQDELRQLLVRFGAEQFTFGQGPDWAGLEFVHGGHLVRFRCPLRPYSREAATAVRERTHQKTLTEQAWPEAEAKRVWRVLVWSVKARLVAVEEELETVEQAFLAHMVDPSTGRTLWEAVRGAIEAGRLQLGGTGLPALGMGDA